MTLTTILIANILLDAALIGGLAHVMSRASRLTPHRPGVTGNAWRLRRPLRHGSSTARGERAPSRLSPVLDQR